MSVILRMHLLPSLVAQLRQHLDTFDILHFHDEVDLCFPLATKRVKKPRLFTCHSLATSRKYYRRHVVARKFFLDSASLFHVFSTENKNALMKLGVEDEMIRIVPHGVDVDRFKPCIRRVLRDFVHIIFVGRIYGQKGVSNLLEAIHVMKQEHDTRMRIKVLIVGKVWEPAYYGQLLEYKSRMKLDEVKFIGSVDPMLMQESLRQADIFVCPSLQDTFPTVNLEAMASGLPVVATSVGAIPEIVVDGETGLLVPPGDSRRLAEKLAFLVGDRKTRENMGRMGRKRAESFFSIDRMALKMLHVYQELL